MHIRSVLTVLAASALFACSYAPTEPAPAGASNAASSGAKKTPAAAAATDKPAATTAPAAAPPSAIDGTWDVSTLGGSQLGPSQITISGSKITGVLVDSDEGTSDGTCTTLKNRITLAMTISGDTLTGTATLEAAFSSPDCGDAVNSVTKIAGTRAPNAKNAAGATQVEGSWVVTAGDDGATPFAVAIAGLAAKIYGDVPSQAANAPAFLTQVQGSSVSTTPTDPEDTSGVTFAARKR